VATRKPSHLARDDCAVAKQFDTIYARLGVKFDHALGESFYNPRLKPLVTNCWPKALARESEGAIAIFFDDIPQLKERPALIRKNDGGFNLRHDRPGHARVSPGDVASGRNHLRDRRTPATAFPSRVFTAFRPVAIHSFGGASYTSPNSSSEKSMGLSELALRKMM